MIDADNVPPVDDEELLARFIVNSNEFRKSDESVKPKLFMPYSRVELSVTRLRDCTEKELWSVGEKIARERERALYGRSDVRASACRTETLEVAADPLQDNPNHANITGYPEAKEDQLAVALKLAAAASNRIPVPVR